jgi:radical SAM superfamily enzyme YgiQ (UPF0313 family)
VSNTVAIVTGGLIDANESSLTALLKKQVKQIRHAKNHWLETKIKVVSAESLLKSQFARKSPKVTSYLQAQDGEDHPPNLTEIVLAHELDKCGVPFELLTFNDLFLNEKEAEHKLSRAKMIFVSSTLLHDLSELMPLIEKISNGTSKVVLGGALTGSLYKKWGGDPMIDVMAIGYGEFLVQPLVDWMRGGFKTIEAPQYGRIVQKDHTTFLFSGVPQSKNLDFIDRPDWKVSADYRKTNYQNIPYESVRGCPYRCSFCNYPFLFDDKVFRYKSADKIFEDWKTYAAEGVKHITCLDSLFTIPKKRLVRLCELIKQHKLKITWSCYARADDLKDEVLVKMMVDAGASHVQIGIESGSDEILANMNKRCTVVDNIEAIRICKKYGLTTLVSLIVGYPGETKETIAQTLDFVRKSQPDFYFIATFSTRIEEVPMFDPSQTIETGLETMENKYSFAPYWRHNTYDCTQVGNDVRLLNQTIMSERLSLDGAMFYAAVNRYLPADRPVLLDYQYKLLHRKPIMTKLFDRLNSWVDKRLQEDFQLWIQR